MMMDEEFSASSLINFLNEAGPDPEAAGPSSPVSLPSSQMHLQSLVEKSMKKNGSSASTESPSRPGSSSTPSPPPSEVMVPATPNLPANQEGFRRRQSSKNLDSDVKTTEGAVPKPPLFKSLSTTSDLDNQAVPAKDLNKLFNEAAEAKALVEKEPADTQKKKGSKQPQASCSVVNKTIDWPQFNCCDLPLTRHRVIVPNNLAPFLASIQEVVIAPTTFMPHCSIDCRCAALSSRRWLSVVPKAMVSCWAWQRPCRPCSWAQAGAEL